MSKIMSQNFKSIILSNTQGIYNKEATLDVTGAPDSEVNPGMIVEMKATNPTEIGVDSVVPHPTAGGYSEMQVLLEDELQGAGIYKPASSSEYGAPPNSDLALLANAQIVQSRILQKGDQFLAVMRQASGGTASETIIAKGGIMTSAGNGCMRAHTGTEAKLVRALESVTLPVPGSADARCYIPVEVIG